MGAVDRECLPEFPKKRCSAGALIPDESGKLLLVKPTYRKEWLLPGGVVEADEDPITGLLREVMEEVGLVVHVQSLRCVDYLATTGVLGESLHFLFDCSAVRMDVATKVAPRSPELNGICWVTPFEALDLLPTSISRRLREPKGHLLTNGLRQVPFARSDDTPGLLHFSCPPATRASS